MEKVSTCYIERANRELSNRERPTEMFLFTNHSNATAVEFYKSTGAKIKNGDNLLFVYPVM